MNNKVWYYKGSIYRILGKVRMKEPLNGHWVDAVRYKKIGGSDEEYVRVEGDFYRKFIPSNLVVGDKVVIMSHGKSLGVTQVAKVMESEEFVELDKTFGEMPKIIKRTPNGVGFICNYDGIYEYYYYNETTCRELKIAFKEF